MSARPGTPVDAGTTRDEALDIATELGSSPEAVQEHLRRMPDAYPASVSPRAIVRHTLMTEGRLAPRELRTRVTPGESDIAADELVDELDVVAMDAPGWFAKVAGVIALQGGSIVAAEAFTRDDGVLVDTFAVRRPDGTAGSWWARVEGDLVDAAAGRLAVRARVAKRAEAEEERVQRLQEVATHVTAHPSQGGRPRAVEVRTRDRIGALHAIASAMAELELDIVDADVRTVGPEAIDVFHVRDRGGSPPDDDHLDELVLAVTVSLATLGCRTLV